VLSRLLSLLAVSPLLVTLAGCGSAQPSPAATTAPSPSPAASATPAPAAAGLPAVVAEAMGRVQTLLANPGDAAAMQATFSPSFLTGIPAEKMKGLFTAIKSQLGACKDQSAVQVKSDTTAVVRVKCEHGDLDVTVQVNPAPPHLVEAILLKPAS